MMNTQKFDYMEVSRTLEPKQRQMYFALGNMIYAAKTCNRGYAANVDMCHELALAALTAVNFKSLKAGKAMASVMKYFN